MIDAAFLVLLFLNMFVGMLGITFSPKLIGWIIWFFIQFLAVAIICHAYFIGAFSILLISHLLVSFIFFNSHLDRSALSPPSSLMASQRKAFWAHAWGVAMVLIASFLVMIPDKGRDFSSFARFFEKSDSSRRQLVSVRELFAEADNFIIVILILLLFVTGIACLKILKKKFVYPTEE